MNPRQKIHVWKIITFVMWGILGIGILCLLVTAFIISPTIWLLFWMGVTGVSLVLVVLHIQHTAQWRFVLLAWLVYSIGRIIAYNLEHAGAINAAGLVMAGVLSTQLIAWSSMLLLAIRRDVSLPFLAFSLTAGPILLMAQLMTSGGILAWVRLLQEEPTNTIPPFSFVEPTYMALSCMTSLAAPCFIGHFIWLGVKEYRRDAL